MRLAILATIDNIHTRRWVDFLVRENVEVFVLCDSPSLSKPEDVTVIHPRMNLLTRIVAFKCFPSPFGNNVFKFIPYKRELRRLQPHLIHGIEVLGYGLATVWSGLNVPKVLTPWGNDVFDWPKRSRIARWIVATSLKKADVITTNMPNIDAYLHSEFGIPQERVHGFSWGVDIDLFKPVYAPEVRELKTALQIPEHASIVLSNRQMQEYWGIEHIVRAASIILNESPTPVYFIFLRGAGTPEYEEKMKDLARALGIFSFTRFVDTFLPPRQMAVFLNLADIVISVPKTDLLSISLLEGMACGCVPVVADLPAYRTRITDGENGFLVHGDSPDSIARAVLHVLSHPEIKQSIAEKNISLIRTQDNWNLNARRILDIYRELIEHSGR